MMVKTLDSMSLEELADVYLCNKYGKDPIKCIDCEKHENCPPGKQAIKILNEMTEVKKPFKGAKGSAANHLKARKRAEEILRHADPIRYLVEVEGLKKHVARERIRKYKKTYPDLFDPADLTAPSRYSQTYADEIKADYLEAIKLEKPANYYMEKYGIKYDAAYQRFKYAERKFGAEVKEMNTEDEVSLDDFLKEFAVEVEPETEEENAETKKPIQEDLPAVKQDNDQSQSNIEIQNHEQAQGDTVHIRTKYEELLLEKKQIQEEIQTLNEMVLRYEDIIRSFETVMSFLEENEEEKQNEDR